MGIRVAIVEDDDWIRGNLANQIHETPGFSCIGSFRDGEEALSRLVHQVPHVVLMDINLPKMNGIDCVRKVKALLPSVQVLILTVYEDSERVFDSLRAGASGYLLKRTAQSAIIEAIRDVHTGKSPMTGEIARMVVQYFNTRGSAKTEIEALSKREQEVLDGLSQGMFYKEIAEALGVTIDTVRVHIKSIYGKLHVHSRGEAVARYLGR